MIEYCLFVSSLLVDLGFKNVNRILVRMFGLLLELGYLAGVLRQSLLDNVLLMSLLLYAACFLHSSLSCPVSYFCIACEDLSRATEVAW